MQIVLMCVHEAATTALSATRVQGEEVPDRWYTVENHRVVLSGWPDVVLHHDATELLRNPIFRMPTPAEQEAMFQEAQQASMAQEETIPIANEETPVETEQAPDNGEEISPDNEPPALDTTSGKKKASGG